LTLAGVVGIPVTQSVRFKADRRFNLSEAVIPDADGYASSMMATSPETCGQAMDVPDIMPKAVSLFPYVERMYEPGDQTSMQVP